MHRFDVITIKNVELRRNAFKTTQNYKSDHITMNLHRFHVKTIKTTQNYKTIKLQWIASIWRHNDKNVELRRNAFKTTQNYKSNQITMTCIYLMSKHWKQPKTKIVIILRWICIYLMSNRSIMLSYVSMHSKQHKTTKVIKLQWLASIWCQKHQNNEKLQTRSNYDDLHRFDVKTI